MTYVEKEDRAPATGIAGTVLGSIGTALGLGLFNGGLSLGGNSGVNAMTLEMANKDATIAQLRSEQSTDAKLVEVYKALRVADKQQDANVAALQLQIANINSQYAALATQVAGIQNTCSAVTKVVIPNSNVCPGWGNVTITPAAAG